jgi:predicted porin
MKRVVLACCALLAGVPAAALDLADGRLELAGFGEVAYGRTNNGNVYLAGTKKGSYDNGEFALAALARPREDILLAAQTTFLLEGNAQLDWAFGEYRVSDRLRIRAGKVKLPFGIYEEVEAVGTLRPFFHLPQAVYGPNLLASDSFVGAAVTGRLPLGRWGLQYDLYGGALHLDVMEPQTALLPGADPADATVHDEEARDAVGGRLILTTPVDGLNVRFSAWRGTEEEEGANLVHAVFGPSVEYVTERLSLRAEGFKMVEGAHESILAGYVEAAWMLDEHVQVAGRFDYSRATFPGVPSSSPLLHHQELAAGINYWVSPQLVLKVSYHAVKGNRFAVPADFGPGSPLPSDRTQLLVVGTQFSF